MTSRVNTLENCFFQISIYSRAYKGSSSPGTSIGKTKHTSQRGLLFFICLRHDVKVMLHGRVRFATTIFSATQLCNIVMTLFRMVTILFQHCNPVLRLKSSLRIILCNITFTLRRSCLRESYVDHCIISITLTSKIGVI